MFKESHYTVITLQITIIGYFYIRSYYYGWYYYYPNFIVPFTVFDINNMIRGPLTFKCKGNTTRSVYLHNRHQRDVIVQVRRPGSHVFNRLKSMWIKYIQPKETKYLLKQSLANIIVFNRKPSFHYKIVINILWLSFQNYGDFSHINNSFIYYTKILFDQT